MAHGVRTSSINLAKAHLTNKAATFCAIDSRPFYAVERDGFRMVLQAALDVGAKYGHIDIDAVLPSHQTVRVSFVMHD